MNTSFGRSFFRVSAVAFAAILAGTACKSPHGSDPISAPDEADGPTDAAVYRVPLGDAPALGDPRAPVTIVAFSDYECPFCVRGESIVAQLRKAYGAKIRVVARQAPLAMHPHARAAAAAAWAAGQQGKFWEMHEKLFASSRSLDDETIARLARELGLDMARFQADLPRATPTLEQDHALASALGVNGTPTFFVNGRRIAGAQLLDVWRPILDEEIGKANTLVAAGTKPEAVYDALTGKGLAQATRPGTLALAKAPTPGVPTPTPSEAAAAPCGDCKDGCTAPAEDAPQVKEQVEAGDAPILGDARAPITIVMFSDFQCPFCLRVEATMHALVEAHEGTVRVAWKHLPLPMHATARGAAKAAIAAQQQGRFWEYHDALFAHQDALDPESLDRYAQEVGLDLDKFHAAIRDPRTDAILAADEAEARRLGVTGTPTSFVNGRRLAGAQPREAFEARIEASIAELR